MAAKKIKVAFAFTTIVGLLVWLTISGFNENMRYYVDIKDVIAMDEIALQSGLRVKGKLVPGSVEKKPNSLEVNFLIAQGEDQIKVRYAKELPDTFKDGSEVLVEGKYLPEGYFAAQTLMAKCPSKYETAADYGRETYETEKDKGVNGTN